MPPSRSDCDAVNLPRIAEVDVNGNMPPGVPFDYYLSTTAAQKKPHTQSHKQDLSLVIVPAFSVGACTRLGDLSETPWRAHVFGGRQKGLLVGFIKTSIGHLEVPNRPFYD